MSQSSNNLIRHHTAKFSVKTQCNSALEFPPEERETNKKESTVKKTIRYKIQVFDEVDFSDFSFSISNNPQPFRLKMKAKKFTNLKVTIDNNEETDCTILQLVWRVESFGESK